MSDAGERWARVEELFTRALEIDPASRSDFLKASCGSDTALHEEVEALLVAHEAEGIFDCALPEAHASSDVSGVHPPGTRFGPYEVVGVLGRGGMGVVYLARRADGQFDQEVALKVLPADVLSPRLRERFLAERQILARLSHPNIARLLDGGVDGEGRPYFAMERVRGRPLIEYCDERSLALAARLDLFRTICDAVQHAHQNLVVHRDLKPSNILVEANGTPKLLDFGIGKILDPEGRDPLQTQVGFRLLTPAYAAPEQLRGEPASTASDLYQLGILLYELLTGVHPFPERRSSPAPPEATGSRATRPSLAAREVESDRASERAGRRRLSIDALSRSLKGDLDAIVLKALRPEADRRYRSALELADDVERFLERRPVGARPDSRAYRARLFARRNAAALAVGTAGVLATLAFAAGMAREARRAALERDRAEAVSEFMTGLFASADPFRSNRSTLTVREVLDDGMVRTKRELADDPDVQRQMFRALAVAYDGLELSAEAAEAQGLVVELHRGAPDTPDEVLAREIAHLGTMTARAGRFEEARAFLEEAQRILGRTEDTPTPARNSAFNQLGTGWMVLGDPERAEPLLEASVEGYRRTPGGEESTAASLSTLGLIRRDAQDPDSAERLLRESLAIRERLLGPDDLLLANSLEALGRFFIRQHRIAEADSAFRATLRIREAGLPHDHFLLTATWAGLANVAAARGDIAGADSLMTRVITAREAANGPEHFSVGYALNDRAIHLQRTGRPVEAEADFRRAHRIFSAHHGRDHPYTAAIGANLAWILAETGRTEAALEHYRAALPVLHAESADEPGTWRSTTDYGIVLCRVGDPAGEPPLRDASRELRRIAPGTDDALRARNALGSCLGGLGNLAEAVEILEGVLRDTDGRPDTDPYRAFALQVLGRIGQVEDGRRTVPPPDP